MQFISDRGLELIRQFEGFSPAVYLCPAGRPTVGYGHVVEPNEDFSRGVSRKEAESLLLRDAAVAENAVNRLIDVRLTQAQFDALVSFTFNLGATALARSTLRKRLNNHEFNSVPSELMRWVYANGRILDGLTRRRAAEAALFREGGAGDAGKKR